MKRRNTLVARWHASRHVTEMLLITPEQHSYLIGEVPDEATFLSVASTYPNVDRVVHHGAFRNRNEATA